MNQSKVQEVDALEVAKREKLKELITRREGLNRKRGEMLLLIADGDEKPGRKGLEIAEKEIKEVGIEIESIEAILAAMPRRRVLARAADIESELKEVEKLNLRLIALSARIDAAAEAFVLVIREYYDVLQLMYEVRHDGYNYLGHDIGAINSISVFLKKYDLMKYINIGRHAASFSMVENKDKIHHFVSGRLSFMRDEIKRLRGDE